MSTVRVNTLRAGRRSWLEAERRLRRRVRPDLCQSSPLHSHPTPTEIDNNAGRGIKWKIARTIQIERRARLLNILLQQEQLPALYRNANIVRYCLKCRNSDFLGKLIKNYLTSNNENDTLMKCYKVFFFMWNLKEKDYLT